MSEHTYKVAVDGTPLLSFTDNTFTNGGVGLISNRDDMNLILDNFRVTSIP